MVRVRALMWVAVPSLIAGCASSVTATDGRVEVDAHDAVMIEEAVVDVAVDVATLGAGRPDAPADVEAGARVCRPIVEVDATVADAPASDAPYVVELAVGRGTVDCARMSDGTVRCIALSEYGQLGDGTVGVSRERPVVVPGLESVEQVLTNIGSATCSRHRDGTVRCWGSNAHGSLGTGHEGDEDCPSVGPCRTRPALVAGVADVVHLAMSDLGGVCAVKRDGTVWCWGDYNHLTVAEDRSVPSPVPGISDVAMLWPLSGGWVARLRSGAYRSLGTDFVARYADAIPAEAEITRDHAGWSSHLCYRLPDSSARCFGFDIHGQLGSGRTGGFSPPIDPGLCGVRSVVGTFSNTCALMADHTVQCWGRGTYGMLGFPPPDTCSTGDASSDPCATRPAQVVGLDGAERLFGGFNNVCVIRFDRSVWCWGSLGRNPTGTLARMDW